MEHPVESAPDVDPQRWAEWLAKGKRIDRLAARRTLGLALAVIAAGGCSGLYFLLAR